MVKERILDSAFQLYMSKPPYEVTVEEIANKAGVSKSLIFYHFKNKDNLVEEVAIYGTRKFLIEGEIESISDLIDLGFSTLTGRKPLLEFSMYVAEVIAKRKRFERFRELFKEIMEQVINPLFVKEGIKEPEKTALLISAMLDGLSLYHYLFNIEDIVEYKKIVLEFIDCRRLERKTERRLEK
jgi:AcrR family transcriptional regulator